MSEQFIIRDAAPADAGALTAFNLSMARETEGLRLSPAAVKRGVDAVFADPARGFYVVAQVADDASAGAGDLAAALMVTREWSDWRCAEWWWIQSVYVRAEFRRRGLYRALHEHVAARATAADEKVCGLRLYVERDNRAAQSTYAALGMRETRYKMFAQSLDDASV